MTALAFTKATAIRIRPLAEAKGVKVKNISTLREVLKTLADKVGDDFNCIAHIRKLAYDCEIDKSTVRRALTTLEKLGLVKRIHRRISGNRNEANIFQLFLDPPKETAPVGVGGNLPPTPQEIPQAPELDRVATCDPVEGGVGRNLRGKRTSLLTNSLTNACEAETFEAEQPQIESTEPVEQNQPQTPAPEKFFLTDEWEPDFEYILQRAQRSGDQIGDTQFIMGEAFEFTTYMVENQTKQNTQRGWTAALFKQLVKNYPIKADLQRKAMIKAEALEQKFQAELRQIDSQTKKINDSTPKTTLEKLTDTSWATGLVEGY